MFFDLSVAFSTPRVRSVAVGVRGTVGLCASVAIAVLTLIAFNGARSHHTNERKKERKILFLRHQREFFFLFFLSLLTR
jgi:hypothetical protein